MSYTYKLLIPADGAVNPFTVSGTGRSYSCAVGSTVLVPDFDANLMLGSGWVNSIGSGSAAHSAGPTSSRPVNPPIGHTYNDTTIGAAIVWGGFVTGWRHHATGASA